MHAASDEAAAKDGVYRRNPKGNGLSHDSLTIISQGFYGLLEHLVSLSRLNVPVLFHKNLRVVNAGFDPCS